MAQECKREILPFKYVSIFPLDSDCGGVQFEECTLDPSQFVLDTDYKYDADYYTKGSFVVISDVTKIPTQYENIFFDSSSEQFVLQDNEGYSYGTIRYRIQVSQSGELSACYVLRSWEPNGHCYTK